MFLGAWPIDALVTFCVNTHDPTTGAATDADSAPAYRVYEDETGTPILTGTMALLDGSNTVGFYSEQITLSAANGFEVGKSYSVYISAAVGGVTGTTHHQLQVIAAAQSFPANFSSLSIDANGRVKAQTAVQKNVAFNNFLFQMTDATTHDPKTGLVNGDFTKQESIDGAAGAALSGTITEVDAGDLPGFYTINLTAGELNGNAIGLRFAAAGCDDTELTILTNA